MRSKKTALITIIRKLLERKNKESESEKKVIADKAALSKLDTINEQVRDFA